MKMRRALYVIAIMGLIFALAAPSSSAQKKKKKPPGSITTQVKVEGTTWFWASQESAAAGDVTGGCPPQLPTCVDQRVSLPNPHEIGALPVQILDGKDEKLSAIQFDLGFLSELPAGADVSKFTFSVIESPDGRDKAQFVNAANKSILACLITDFWPPSEDGAEDIENAPSYDCTKSVPGTRSESTDGSPAKWTFDITQFAKDWGKDPFSANGMMLAGKVSGTESWQIVLKGPRRDTQETPANEEELNANNVKASITYTEIPEEELPEEEPVDTGGGGGTTTTPPVTTSSPVTTTPSTGDFGIGSTTAAAPEPFVEETPLEATIAPVATEQPGPEMPPYVWLLIPVGLLALSLVRSVVMEPALGKRPDGVVALIRERNAQRRGTALPSSATSPLAGVTGFFRSIGTGVRRGGRGLTKSIAKLTKKGGS